MEEMRQSGGGVSSAVEPERKKERTRPTSGCLLLVVCLSLSILCLLCCFLLLGLSPRFSAFPCVLLCLSFCIDVVHISLSSGIVSICLSLSFLRCCFSVFPFSSLSVSLCLSLLMGIYLSLSLSFFLSPLLLSRGIFVGHGPQVSILQYQRGRIERGAVLQLRDRGETVHSMALDAERRRLFVGYGVRSLLFSFTSLLLFLSL